MENRDRLTAEIAKVMALVGEEVERIVEASVRDRLLAAREALGLEEPKLGAPPKFSRAERAKIVDLYQGVKGDGAAVASLLRRYEIGRNSLIKWQEELLGRPQPARTQAKKRVKGRGPGLRGRYPEDYKRRILAEVAAGKINEYQIEKREGLGKSTVSKWAAALRVKMPKKTGRGTRKARKPEGQYTSEQKDSLVARVTAGESFGAVSRASGVPKGTIMNWARGRGLGNKGGKRRTYDADFKKKIVQEVVTGGPGIAEAIAKREKMSPATISNWVNGRGI